MKSNRFLQTFKKQLKILQYCIKNINFANAFLKSFDYKNDVNDEIYFFTLQKKIEKHYYYNYKFKFNFYTQRHENV